MCRLFRPRLTDHHRRLLILLATEDGRDHYARHLRGLFDWAAESANAPLVDAALNGVLRLELDEAGNICVRARDGKPPAYLGAGEREEVA